MPTPAPNAGPWPDDALPCARPEAIERLRTGEWLVSVDGRHFGRWSELTADEQRWILCCRPFRWFARPVAASDGEGGRPAAPVGVSCDIDTAALTAMRHVVLANPSAKPDALIKAAGMRRTKGRAVLRALERLGEYAGFARSRPERYRKP